MRITLLVVGKTKEATIKRLQNIYIKRLQHYTRFNLEIIPELKTRKNHSEKEQKLHEGEAILKKLQSSDKVVLLDEKGKSYSSVDFANWLQKQMLTGKKRLVFIIGGPYGFSEEVYNRSQHKIALSKMTFSHEMIRPFFAEQIYRAFTILRNESYHHG